MILLRNLNRTLSRSTKALTKARVSKILILKTSIKLRITKSRKKTLIMLIRINY